MQALPCSLFSTGKAARGLIFLFTVGALESILEYHSSANYGSDRTLDFQQDRRKAPKLYTSNVQFKRYGVKCLSISFARLWTSGRLLSEMSFSSLYPL